MSIDWRGEFFEEFVFHERDGININKFRSE